MGKNRRTTNGGEDFTRQPRRSDARLNDAGGMARSCHDRSRGLAPRPAGLQVKNGGERLDDPVDVIGGHADEKRQ